MPQRLAPCGTNSAYLRHWRRKEKPCGPCKQAHAEYNNRYRPRKRTALQPCGTNAAYLRHIAHGDRPYNRENRAERRALAGDGPVYQQRRSQT